MMRKYDKLTYGQVEEMRIRYSRNEVSMGDLAKYYNVNVSTIHNAIRGKTWKKRR